MAHGFGMGARLACAVAALGVLAAGCGSADQATPSSSSGDVLTGAGGGAQAGATTSTSTGSGPTSGGSGGAGGADVKLGPPYPIVLAHGFFGFEDFAGAGFLTYFYQIREHFAAQGETVYTPSVDPFNSSAVRGAELATEIEAILAVTGHAKVNLIGHSQGGLDARVVAHERPDLVASVTTIGTPHHGTPVADIALGLVSDPNQQAVLDWIFNTLGKGLYDQLGGGSSIATAMEQFSQPGIQAFNATYTDAASVRYASITGRTAYHKGGGDCTADVALPFVTAFESELDPVDALLSPTQSILQESVLSPVANDGLVQVKDARWGTFLGCVPADHLDEVGQLFGDSPGLTNAWDYVELYDALVAYLRDQGL